MIERPPAGRLGERRRKVAYYFDEASILLVGVLAVLFSRAFNMYLHGKHPRWSDVWTGSLELTLAVISAVSFYGAVHVKWRYNDSHKPSWPKRAAGMVMQGISWRTMWEG